MSMRQTSSAGRRMGSMRHPGTLEGCILLLLYQTCSGVEVTAPSSQTALYHTRTLLPCTFTVNNPPIDPTFLAIFWYLEGEQLVRYDNKEKVTRPGVSIDEQEVNQGNASLSIHSVTISNHGTYSCLVIYSPERQEKKIQLHIQAVPGVKIHKKALPSNEKSQVQCSVTDFFPREIKVTWLRNGQALTGSVLETFQINADGTFNVNSSVTVTAMEAKSHPIITCQVEHESLEDPIHDGFKVEYGEPPSVQVLSSKTPDGKEHIYVCEVTGYFPEDVEINWLLDGKRTEPARKSDAGLFNKEIYYQLAPSKDNLPTQISCEVHHETLDNPIMKTLQVDLFNECMRTCHYGLLAIALALAILAYGIIATGWYFITKKKYFQRFQVSPIHRDPVRSNDVEVILYCVASNCETDAQVTWTVTEDGSETIRMSEINRDEENVPLISGDYTVMTERSHDPQKLHNVFTALKFTTDGSKIKNRDVTCRFLCAGRSQERRFHYIWNLIKPEISGEMKLSLSDAGEVLCSVTLVKFHPRDIQINWSCGSGHYQELDTRKNQITPSSDHSYNAVSECRVPGHLFKDPGFRVRVTWSHQSLDGPESREVSAADFPWRPVMGEIMIPPLLHNTEAKLQCTISVYFPGDLDVMWMRREAGKPDIYRVSPSDKYKIPEHEITPGSDNTMTCTASLIVSVSSVSDHGAEFICRVRHPTLSTPLEKKTGELSVGGIPTVNVTNYKKHLTAEVSNFFPKNIKVTWSRIKHNCVEYEKYDEKDHTIVQYQNKDGTFTCISEITAKDKDKIRDKKCYKITVEHESLKEPLEKIVMYDKGKFYHKDGETWIPLSETQKK